MAAIGSKRHPQVLDALVNPANETLVGTALAYFPIGGPTPAPPPPGADELNWGGTMDGSGKLLYREQVTFQRVLKHGLARNNRERPRPLHSTPLFSSPLHYTPLRSALLNSPRRRSTGLYPNTVGAR